MALEASATLMFGAKCVPAVMIDWYKLFTISAVSAVDPDVTFLIFEGVYLISGLTLSE